MKRLFAVLVAVGLAVLAGLYFNGRRQTPVAAVAAAPVPAGTTSAIATSSTASAAPASSQAPIAFVANQHYGVVLHPSPVQDPKIVSVEEFFWYGCPHCYRMEPLLTDWLKTLPGDVRFTRVPENLGRPEGLIHQRAFYAAQNLGIESKIHLPFMTALVVQHVPLLTPQTIANFAASEGHVSTADFNSQFSSFVVDGEVNRATALALSYGITGVPTLVVGGRYLVDSSMPGIVNVGKDEGDHFRYMLAVAGYLVDKTRDEQAEMLR